MLEVAGGDFRIRIVAPEKIRASRPPDGAAGVLNQGETPQVDPASNPEIAIHQGFAGFDEDQSGRGENVGGRGLPTGRESA